MITTKTIKCENETAQTVYGIKGTCGTAVYSFDDVSTKKENAEIIDKILSAVALPVHLIDRFVSCVIGLLAEVNT